MSRREKRFKEFATLVDNARVIAQTDVMTAFHTMLTKERFAKVASQLADQYIVFFKYNLADEKPINPPTYHYVVILEEKDNTPPFEYPEEFTRFGS